VTAILGISAFYHDSAATLVVDGDIVAAAQEERFTRKKHDAGFPALAVRYCLDEAGLKASDLDYVVFYEKPLRKFERLLETYLAYAPVGFRSFRMALPVWLKEKTHLPKLIRQGIGVTSKTPLVFTDHHESHAASAFFPSPFDEAAILTLDGVGESTTAAFGVGSGNRMQLTRQLEFPHSLGLLYSAFTYYCGFKVNSGEYKLMGLAPYGRPIYKDAITKHLIDLKPDGSFWLDMDYFSFHHSMDNTFSRKFETLFGPPRKRESEFYTLETGVPDGASKASIDENQFYADVAKAIRRPSAVRAVARACATNPVAIAIPCHRVIRSDGQLGGYRWGHRRKEALLQMEAGKPGN